MSGGRVPSVEPSINRENAFEVTVVIVSHNSRGHLAQCLPAVLEQGIADLEVIVVDCASDDDTISWVRGRYPDVHVLEAGDNLGYAGGNNLGIRNAQGRYVLVLNPDTVPLAGSMSEMLRVVRERPGALVMAKLVQPDGTVNTCGNDMHFTGIVTCTGLGDDPASYRGVRQVFLASGAAVVASRALWTELGGFCESMFMYGEDADLSLRARVLGCDVLCAADAVIEHDYALRMTPRKFYLLERGRLLTIARIYEGRTLARASVALGLMECATWAYAIGGGPRYLGARAQALWWMAQHVPEWSMERRWIQNSRRVPDDSLLPGMVGALPFGQLMGPRAARFLSLSVGWLFDRLRPSVLPL